MRYVVVTAVVLFASVAYGADAVPKVSGRLDGKPVQFPAKSVAAGVKATVGLLETCHDESLYQADELKQAEQGDHVRLTFARPIPTTIMGEMIAASELVFRQPLNTGVFWVRTGDTWRRYSKYEPRKTEPFVAWLREGQPGN